MNSISLDKAKTEEFLYKQA